MLIARNGNFVTPSQCLKHWAILFVTAHLITGSCWANSDSGTDPCFKDIPSQKSMSFWKDEGGVGDSASKGPVVILHTEGEQPPGDDVSSSGDRQDIPYLRNSLARAVYMKMKEDENNRNDRHVYWYRVIVSRLSPDLQKKFIQFEQDEKTDEFIEHCIDLSDEIFTQLFHTVARTVLKLFMTQTSINGYLHRGSMFIFSSDHIEKLLGISSYYKGNNLLDLGAGDGKVTKVLAQYYKTTYATEISSVMVKRLTSNGFNVLALDEWQTNDLKYDLISCLNLLDRCDKPMKLLSEIHSSLASGGRALIAVVIPFKPYVEFESATHEPTELIRVKGASFEEEVEQFSRLFDQSGFTVEAFTRLPYLCEGDMHHSYYVLSDAVFVLKKAGDESS